MDNIEDDARRLLDRMKLVPPREPGEKLRYSDQARILDLADQGWTQERIAAEIGCHQSTVSRLIAEFDDSRPLGRRYLNAQAMTMAERFVTNARPPDLLRMMAKLDMVREDGTSGGSDSETCLVVGFGVTMNVMNGDGSKRPPADLFEPDDVITVHQRLTPPDAPATPELMVERKLPGNAMTVYALPCDVSEIPPNVKIMPEALEFLRNRQP